MCHGELKPWSWNLRGQILHDLPTATQANSFAPEKDASHGIVSFVWPTSFRTPIPKNDGLNNATNRPADLSDRRGSGTLWVGILSQRRRIELVAA